VRTLGTLTLLYGLGLLLYAAFSAAVVAGYPFLSDLLGEVQEQQNAQQASRAASALAALKEQEEAAVSEVEKASVRVDRIVLENTRAMGMPTVFAGMGILDSPRTRRFLWIQTLAVLGLALPLALAGLGMMARKDWGRKLALVDSALIVAASIGLTVVSIVWIAPLMADAWALDIEKLVDSIYGDVPRGAAPGPAGEGHGPGIRRMMSVLMALYGLIGIIYPVVLLYVLRRPGIVAECARRPVS
jgi:hypothetical protein